MKRLWRKPRKFGEMQNIFSLADQTEAPGPDGNARAEVADDRTEAQAPAQGHRQDGGAQIDQAVRQPGGSVFHGPLWRVAADAAAAPNGPGRTRSPARAQAIFTYSKSPAWLLMPTRGGAIQLAYCPGAVQGVISVPMNFMSSSLGSQPPT